MKTTFKYLAILLCCAAFISACKKDSYEDDNFDYEAQYKTDTTAIRAFLVANKITAVKDVSGIFYQVITPGAGNIKYAGSTQFTANYKGRLLSGKTFDSTAVNSPVKAYLGNMIVGWQIGLQKIQKGGKIRLFVPSYYGYGNQDRGPIPANSVLDFDIELLDVTQ